MYLIEEVSGSMRDYDLYENSDTDLRTKEQLKYERIHAHAKMLHNKLQIRGYKETSKHIIKLKYIMQRCDKKLEELRF